MAVMMTTRINLLGIGFDALLPEELLMVIDESIHSGDHKIIGSQNLHGVYLFHHDREMQAFYSIADKIHIDGMPLIILAKIFGYPVRREHRITYLDIIWPLMAESERQEWKVFYLGGRPGVAEKAAQNLKESYPKLSIKTHDGYFEQYGDENSRVIELIRDFDPNILMVGMGMPLQEKWILDNHNKLNVNVFLTPGACFDYIGGITPDPPRWMGQIGLEWLFRLASEPKRLWKRYLLEPWYVLLLIVKELFG